MLTALKNYKKCDTLSLVIMVTSITCLILNLIVKVIFSWAFLDYINAILSVIFILSLVIGTIPTILEKNYKRLIVELLFISIIIFLFFLVKY
ncbi:hypothetical protein MHZ36_09415 [Staphylococcus sp. ACRSN]|uniref:hypothetical protein n=1 Tax=Staphylococcus sp. ACRSN TaxID=2918214 RepID=UPI001EF38E4D|nr:hypothetical protein [Staphylococcus sp. ACRSN]MCG7339510.1 hypothetical protein [Staphylococcus sp. ACRSN]